MISGTGSFAKTGSGGQVLTGANTYSGTTTVSNGVLNIRHNTALGSTAGATTVASGASLDLQGSITVGTEALTLGGTGMYGNGVLRSISGFNSWAGPVTSASNSSIGVFADRLTISGVIGEGFTASSLTKVADGTLRLSAANTYTGATLINAGTLQLSGSGQLPDSSDVTVASGATFDLNGVSDTVQALSGSGSVTLGSGTLTVAGSSLGTTFSGTISGSGGLAKTGSGTQILDSANTYTGVTSVSAGVLNIQNGSAPGSTATGTTVSSGAALELQGDITVGLETLTLNGAGPAGNGALRNTSGTNSWNGTVTLASDSTIGASSGTLTLGGVVGQSGGSRSLTKAGSGTLVLSGACIYTGATLINAGTLQLSGTGQLDDATDVTVGIGATFDLNNVSDTIDGLSGSSWVDLGTATLTVGGNNGSATFAGHIAGSGGLAKTGSGTQTLTSASSYSGATSVNAGVLNVQNFMGLGSTAGGTTVASGAALEVQNDIAVGSEALTLGGTGISGTGALRSISGNNSWAGAVTLASNSTIGVDADTLTISGAIGESGGNRSLTKVGDGTLTLTAANTYAGATIISAGTLQYGSGQLSDSTDVTVNSGATYDLNGVSDTIDALAGSGSVTLGAATLTVGGNNGTGTFSGIISGAGGVAKIGTGTQTLDGGNTYNGTTTISAGALRVGHSTGLGSTAGGTTVADGASLELSGDIAVGAEALTLNGSGVGGTGALRNLSGDNSWAGTVTLASSSAIGADAGTLTVSGTIGQSAGPCSLVKVGDGTLTVAGTVTYGGNTDIDAGTLGFDYSGSNSLGGTVTIAGASSAAILRLLQGTLTANSSVLDGGGTSYLCVDNGTMTINGNLTVDNLRVGVDGGIASLDVTGTVKIGSSGDLDIGRRTSGDADSFGGLDLGTATSVTTTVDNLRLGTITSGPTARAQGTLVLSVAGSNTIDATTMVAGDSPTADNTTVTSMINLGTTNAFNTDTCTIARRQAVATVDIVPGGKLTLSGRTDPSNEADLFLGDNVMESSVGSVGTLDLTAGTFDATLDEVVLGRHGNGLGFGQGIVIMDAGTVTANSVDMGWPHFTGTSTFPLLTTGTLTMRNGSFTVSGNITVHSGQGTLNLYGGTLNVGGSITSVPGPTGPGIITINLDGGELDVTGGSIGSDQPEGPVDFNFTTGMLRDVGIFFGDLDQYGGTLAPGAVCGTTTITGSYNLHDGTLEIEIQSPGQVPGVDYDVLDAGGAVHLDSIVEIVLLDEFVPRVPIDWLTAESISLGPGFALDQSRVIMPGGGYFMWELISDDGRQRLQFVLVPEPAGLTLLVLGGLSLVAFAWRRNCWL